MDDTLPLVDSATLSDAEKKRLRNSHPLYGRMNGEVIWVAYEELGYDAETCATAMDAELDLRHRTVSLMATLEQCPDACCVLELPEAPCASCTACPDLEHLSIDAMTPQWRQCLPPYAIGCRVHARLLSHKDAQQAGCSPVKGDDLPRRGMLCPCLTPQK